MEKLGLKNIKIVIIFMTVLIVVVLLLNFQAVTSDPMKNPKNNPQTQQEDTTSEEDDSDTEESDALESEEDNESNTKKQKAKTLKNSNNEYNKEYNNGYNNEYNNNFENNNQEKYTSVKPIKQNSFFEEETVKPIEKKPKEVVVIEKPVKEKTPQEAYEFALLEMRRGRLNSAIYEFNNTIDIATDSNIALKARKHLAECYERKGINSEAFDIYEYIYLETGKKEDLLELNRISKKSNRISTSYTYIEQYIENHPDEQEEMQQYLR